MSFEDNPADNENYERDLAYEEIRQLQTELASVTARLAAAEAKVNAGQRFTFTSEALGTTVVYRDDVLRDGIWRAYNASVPDSNEIKRPTLDAAIAAAVSAGWMKPLGDNTKETT